MPAGATPTTWVSAITAVLWLMLSMNNAQAAQSPALPQWKIIPTQGIMAPRHEASLVAFNKKLYLIGGRGIKPVNVYDPRTNMWTAKAQTPIELHHFQAIVHGDAIYILGAMTGGWPKEKPIDRIIIYYPEEDRFVDGPLIPAERRRGGAGVAIHDGKFYMIGGITNGHLDGYVPWFDEFDPATGQWRILPGAPQARDHFQAVIANGKLYAFAGRRTEYAKNRSFEQTLSIGDIYDFETGQWQPMNSAFAIPTERAGNMALAWKGQIIVGGGESGSQETAHDAVEAFDPVTSTWRQWPALRRGRHGSGFAVLGDYLYTASGSGNRGGEPELASLERLKLLPVLEDAQTLTTKTSAQMVTMQWHEWEQSFVGPALSETSADNPFTDYRLTVTFTHEQKKHILRGFYAADGRAAETGAQAGNIWQVRFTPDQPGQWTWQARLSRGPNIAIDPIADSGETIALAEDHGQFLVVGSDKSNPDFRHANRGKLVADKGYFRFVQSGQYWLKGGTNSPENLLGYHEFDNSFRMAANARDGESDGGLALHKFTPHLQDWRPGDPSWRGGKGKALVGAINYLASQKMNSAYFLTLNIMGDGKDVWPYRSPQDFTRFDVSKLDQWEIIFDHMQAKGILLHIVLQETENELMHDAGDTGIERKLYLSELIARFGHHNGLVWNLGEENGPVHWRPEGQNDQQRKQMIDYITAIDPYDHPILLHTHSEAADKDAIAGPLLGYPNLDGLSFQVSERTSVNDQVRKWRSLSADNGKDWLITMDEIGKWNVGALPDNLDQTNHESLRRHALWGHLLGGGGGVEWYFGAHYPANDLTSEDWRLRESLWRQTAIALDFFETNLPYWAMRPCQVQPPRSAVYCFGQSAQLYALYLPDGGSVQLDSGLTSGRYRAIFLDPVTGKSQAGTPIVASPKGQLRITAPTAERGRDWVAFLQAQ
ncbi:MAG: DUF5060 domain-containing protein [Parasphingorhabdus sp.]